MRDQQKQRNDKQKGSNQPTKPRIEDLDWAVISRYKNQKCALKLYKLLEKYEEKKGWGKDESMVARYLVGVVFSLWRAAFLGDKIYGTASASRKKATAFLAKVIQDNAINYPQDRDHREWTFDYYVVNAILILRYLRTKHDWLLADDGVNNLSDKKNWEKWKQHWNRAHDVLSNAVTNFDRRLKNKMSEQKK